MPFPMLAPASITRDLEDGTSEAGPRAGTEASTRGWRGSGATSATWT